MVRTEPTPLRYCSLNPLWKAGGIYLLPKSANSLRSGQSCWGIFMKKLFILIAMFGLAATAFSQGQVTLANNASTLITNFNTGLPIAVGSISFQLLAGADAGSLAPVGPVVGTSGFAGRIALTIIYIAAVPPGATATFRIQAWDSSWASFQAVANSGMAVTIGQSMIFTSETSPNIDPPPLPISLAGKYAPFTVGILPEPSTIALGVISAVSLLLVRRRK